MSYDTLEQSQHDGAPQECYRFLGSFKNYLYTSSDDIVSLGGLAAGDYAPLPISRNTLKTGTQDETGVQLEVSLPYDVDVVKDYGYSQSPPSLTLEVYRIHRGDDPDTGWRMVWKGKVTAISLVGRTAKITVPSIFSQALDGNMPSAYYQNPCNHVLFDSGCKIARALFAITTTVTGVAQLAFDVVDDGFADHFLTGGEAVNQRTGERRLILDNIVNTISLNYPFVDNEVGDSIELTAGCDHSWDTCKAKFNNGDNYGGHPFVPADNPFQGSLSS